MKKLFFTLLLFIPLFSVAQENLLGKSRQEIIAAMKEAKCSFVKLGMTKSKAKPTKLTWYDRFHSDNGSDLLCFYNNSKDDTCRKVREVRNISMADSVRQALNATAINIKKDAWTNKARDVKITLTASKKYNFMALDYVPANKRKD
jgi:hypothetical protein